MMGWVNGAGFPKATRVKDAPAFNGHRYGLQAMKPALEPIICFQKPYKGKPVDCITRTGVGTLNVDGARVETQDNLYGGSYSGGTHKGVVYGLPGCKRLNPGDFKNPAGRWPANFYVDEHGAAALDAMSGTSASVRSMRGVGFSDSAVYGAGDASYDTERGYNDQGGVSRFFFNAVADQIDDADAVGYYAKASRKERDAGMDGFEAQQIRRHSGGDFAHNSGSKNGAMSRNPHPTIKPISLTRWLATLLLPPAIYTPRRLFIPFAGAASEMIGAGLAGWDEVTGVEMMNDTEHPYVDIARARLAHWLAQPALIGGAA
jgi:hypothetical protein